MSGSSSGYRCLGNIKVSGGKLTIPPGVYVLDASSGTGSLTVSGSASISCDGCAFVLTNRNASPTATIGKVDISGSGAIRLTASDTGYYHGIVVYQDRRTAFGTNDTFSGGTNSYVFGSLYFPRSLVNFSGQSFAFSDCLQIVGWQLNFSGGTNVGNNCPAGFGNFGKQQVRLVA